MTNIKHKTTQTASHTVGPWRFERSSDTARCIGTIRSVPGNHWLATIDSFDGAVTNEANANLMATAPELLDSLRDTLNMLRAAYLDLGMQFNDNKRARKACDVVAKATGRAA